jgi:hypothetical protein
MTKKFNNYVLKFINNLITLVATLNKVLSKNQKKNIILENFYF